MLKASRNIKGPPFAVILFTLCEGMLYIVCDVCTHVCAGMYACMCRHAHMYVQACTRVCACVWLEEDVG